MSTKLEQQLKQALENYSVEYNPADWNDLEKRLDQVMPVKPNNSVKPWILGGLSALIGVGLLTYVLWPKQAQQIAEQHLVMPVSELATEELKTQVLENQPSPEIPVSNHVASNSVLLESHAENESKTVVESEQNQAITPDAKVSKPAEIATKIDHKTPEKSVDAPIQANIRAKQEACMEEELTFTAESNCQNCDYVWDFGRGADKKGLKVKTSFEEAGQYPIRLSVSQNGETKVFERQIVIHPKPHAELDYNYSVEDQIPTYHFTYAQKDVPVVQWTFASDKKYSGSACHHVFYEKGMHDIQVKAISNKGCIQEFTKSVDVDHPLTLLAPNSFSPNGDGKNETWMPILLQENNMPFTLQIFDRNKALVYSTTNPNAGWDGRMMTTNKKATMGQVFVWFAEVQINGQERRGFKGEIVVVE